MTLIEALKDDFLSVRVSCGCRWMMMDHQGVYTVLSRPYGTKRNRTLIITEDEEAAVARLTDTQEENEQH